MRATISIFSGTSFRICSNNSFFFLNSKDVFGYIQNINLELLFATQSNENHSLHHTILALTFFHIHSSYYLISYSPNPSNLNIENTHLKRYEYKLKAHI